MPIPFMAAGALATILGATQDCEHNLSDDEGYQRKALPPSTTPADAAEVATSPTNNSNAKQKETSVRSIVYESSVSRKNLNRSSTRHLLATEESFLRHHNKALPAHRVELPLLASIDVDEDNNEIAGGGIPANHSTEHDDCSYLDASFRSGLTASMAVDEGCFAIAAAVTAADVSLWAVGTVGAVQVYLGTTLATTIILPCSTSRGSRNSDKSAMVSALCWVDGNLPHTTKQSQRHTLVVTTLGGQMAVYRIDPELLEVEGGGVQPLLGGERFVWDVRSEVRSVAATVWDDLVLVILGDVTGELHLFSWPLPQWNNRQAKSLSHVTLSLASAAILQVAWHPSPDSRQFALATEGGAVDVYDLNSDLATSKLVWSIQRAGPVRALDWNAGFLALGGYDKTCVLVDTSVWGIARELVLDGTINALAFDKLERYLAVGCRDKSLTLLDTSTWQVIKHWGTEGWVTSASWLATDRLALRSGRKRLSVLDLTPTQYTPADRRLFASVSTQVATTWLDKSLLARTVGMTVVVADSRQDFETVATWKTGPVQFMALDPASQGRRLATLDTMGHLTLWQTSTRTAEQSVLVEPGLRALAWSADGKLLATGGKQKTLHVWHVLDDGRLERATPEPLVMGGRIWDLSFTKGLLAVALGDYTAVLMSTTTWEASLQITRSRTVRCCTFHPQESLLAIGDGSGEVAIVDYEAEEVLHDFTVGSRVNSVQYSPVGDYLLVGNDDNLFTMHHTSSYQCLQEFHTNGFAWTAEFSPGGSHLVLGSGGDGAYGMVRLGPLLGIDLVPLSLPGGIGELSPWAQAEVLYRSAEGPSFVQRHMMNGGPDNLQRVSDLLGQYPGALYAYDRSTGDTFFHTALQLRKPQLLKLVVSVMVDGSLDRFDERSSVLTTSYPRLGRRALGEIVNKYSAEMVGDVFQAMTFLKVPFADSRPSDNRHERAHTDFRDPWIKTCLREEFKQSRPEPGRNVTKSTSLAPKQDLFVPVEPKLTPAVLPLPGLGEMDFLACLLSFKRAEIWENEAMALVLRVMWKNHIRKFFIIDFILYLALCACWVFLLEADLLSSSLPDLNGTSLRIVQGATFGLNSLYALKETIEARYGRRQDYFRSFWNAVDVLAVGCIYAYLLYRYGRGDGNASVPLAVVATLVSTMKLLSYLRGFGQTGWLISVLGANFYDVRGFLVVLLTILVGFAVAFRLLFNEISDESFGTLRRSFLSTFELTIIGSYDSNLLYDSEKNALAIFTFILAVTCCLVVTLNALISLLSDSYARIMENATANRRKERAGLIVEYMSLLPPRRRRKIESQTQWFHTLLEADSDGELKVGNDDWEGGLNALRRDMAELEDASRKNHEKLFQQLKTDMEVDMASFRKQVMSTLADIQTEMKQLSRNQKEGGITFSGKRVKNVMKAVKSIGRQTSLFSHEESS